MRKVYYLKIFYKEEVRDVWFERVFQDIWEACSVHINYYNALMRSGQIVALRVEYEPLYVDTDNKND